VLITHGAYSHGRDYGMINSIDIEAGMDLVIVETADHYVPKSEGNRCQPKVLARTARF
jgi:hypothetical protein